MRFYSILVFLVVALPVMANAAPEIGKPAPAFEFKGVDGAVHRLADHAGKRAVVVAWFPKAFTPG